MNIKDAKQQIENAMRSYFTKDEFGKYIIPVERQRPIFLMGPPGIGKTAIMEQVASDLGVKWGEYIIGCNDPEYREQLVLLSIGVGMLLVTSDNLLDSK